jgi:surface protein
MSDPSPPEDYTYPEDYVPPPLLPPPIQSITLHVTKGTPPNQTTYTETIPYAFNGENSFAITNQQLIEDFSNKPAGTKYSYYVTTNFVPGTFTTGDVLTTPTVSNYTVKAIPTCTISEYTFNRAGILSVSHLFSTNSNAPLNFESSDDSLLTIDAMGQINTTSSDGYLNVKITQLSNSEYEGITVKATAIIQSSTITIVPLVLESNRVTISYSGGRIPNTQPTPLFYYADIRRRGTPEWFAVVDDRHRPAIMDYARTLQSDFFTPGGQSSPVPFDNIVTTLMRNMNSMFDNATTFNHPIESWDTSRVTDMNFMFNNALVFNQPIRTWNISNVVFMLAMFNNARRFNQNISSWNLDRIFIVFAFRSGSALINDNTPRRIINAGQ